MRVTLLLLGSFLSLFGPAAALAQDSETPLPERLYVVGNMNQWTPPAINPDCDDYSLTDPDGDGIYTGAFEIDKDDATFKIFDAKTDWDSLHYFGTYDGNMLDMYSDVPWICYAFPDGYSDRISIANWEGGLLTIEVTYTPNSLIIRASGENQPPAPPSPNNFWITGSFNDWAYPENGDTNGALAIPLSTDGPYGYYEGTVTFPAGTNSFAVCCQDPETEEWTKYVTYSAMAPFKLLRTEENQPAVKSISIYPDGEYRVAPTLRDWNGTEITFSLTKGPGKNPENLLLSSYTADYSPIPATLTTHYRVDGGDWKSYSLPYSEYIIPEEIVGREFEIYFSNEDQSVTYGVAEGYENKFGYTDYFKYYDMISEEIPFDQGGKHLFFTSEDSKMRLTRAFINYQYMTGYMAFVENFEPTGDLYLIGSIQGWDISNGKMRLDKIDENVYHGVFPVSNYSNELSPVMFRFYDRLGDWSYDGSPFCYGADKYDGINVGIMIPYSGNMVHGKGNWVIGNLADEYINVTVDTGAMTLVVNGSSGVRYIGSDDSTAVEGIYDLNGLRHDGLTPGINIVRYTDGSVHKIMK